MSNDFASIIIVIYTAFFGFREFELYKRVKNKIEDKLEDKGEGE